MSDKIRKTFEIERKTIDEEAGIHEVWISTEAVDRDGDIVSAGGAEVDNYLKNPIVLFGHNYRDPEAVIGRALEVDKVDGKGIRSRFQFAPWGTSDGADTVRRLWDGGFLNAASVGFRPIDVERRLDDDEEFIGYLFSSWELLEFSIVPVPANQEALRLAIKMLEFKELESPEESTGEEPEPELEPEPDIPEVGEAEPLDPDTTADDQLTEEDLERLAEGLTDLTDALSEVFNE